MDIIVAKTVYVTAVDLVVSNMLNFLIHNSRNFFLIVLFNYSSLKFYF